LSHPKRTLRWCCSSGVGRTKFKKAVNLGLLDFTTRAPAGGVPAGGGAQPQDHTRCLPWRRRRHGPRRRTVRVPRRHAADAGRAPAVHPRPRRHVGGRRTCDTWPASWRHCTRRHRRVLTSAPKAAEMRSDAARRTASIRFARCGARSLTTISLARSKSSRSTFSPAAKRCFATGREVCLASRSPATKSQ
jgi:hypothetical protein